MLRYPNLKTLYVSSTLNISSVRVVVLCDAFGVRDYVDNLVLHKEHINNINCINKHYNLSALHFACLDKDLLSVKKLLELGADPNVSRANPPRFDPWKPIYPISCDWPFFDLYDNPQGSLANPIGIV